MREQLDNLVDHYQILGIKLQNFCQSPTKIYGSLNGFYALKHLSKIHTYLNTVKLVYCGHLETNHKYQGVLVFRSVYNDKATIETCGLCRCLFLKCPN